jgi:lysophospholipase L1-like esterase
MASTGDSITRAFDATWFGCFLADCPQYSWSTGTSSTVNSQYLRLTFLNPALKGNVYNDAKSGAKMADLYGQLNTAATQHVDYVTILIGANDACTGSESTMTTVAAFRRSIDAALATLRNRLPDAEIFIASIPDVGRLWAIGKDDPSARDAWSAFGVCQSMLADPTSTRPADVDRRNRVERRIVDFNTQLAQACLAYGANCAFDDNAVFHYPFALSQVSTWDYFHPNTAGQAALADITYAAGFGW